MLISAIIDRAAARIELPGTWVQGMACCDERYGAPVLGMESCSWDAFGAITAEAGGDPEEIGAVISFIRSKAVGVRSLVAYNDEPCMTQDVMVGFLKSMATLAREEGV